MLHFVHFAKLGETVLDALDFAVAVGKLLGRDRAADALAHFGKLGVSAGRVLVCDTGTAFGGPAGAHSNLKRASHAAVLCEFTS